MKSLLNVIRSIIFIVVIHFLLRLVFFGLNWTGAKGIIFFGDIKEKMDPIIFWMLFAFVGIAILSVLWILFKYTSILVMALLVFICPYRKFAYWSVGVMSVFYSLTFLYWYWFLVDRSLDFRDIMFGVILTVACIQLCISLVEGVFFSYRIEDNIESETEIGFLSHTSSNIS